MRQNDKRIQIYAMGYLPVKDAQVINCPGTLDIKVAGAFHKIPVSAGEFKEKIEPGTLIEQELNATVTDTGVMTLAELRVLFFQEGLLLLKMTNGEEKVVGTDQFPVLITAEISGSPSKMKLSFKRNSPEPAKIFKSF